MEHILEHLGNILAVIAVATLIILNVHKLRKMSDVYATKRDLEKLEGKMCRLGDNHVQFMDRSQFAEHCKNCKEELGMSNIKLDEEIDHLKDLLNEGDKKFTFIQLIQLEMIDKMKLDIPKSRIEALKEIAYNRRT